MPVKYKNTIAIDMNICVNGSVEGVKIADITVEIKILYFEYMSI